jgi:predicted nucleotidyltransferase
MAMPPTKARLLDEIASALTKVANVEAVALGGSHARGTHGPDSDLDIGIYYREAAPFRIDDIRQIAQAFSASGAPTVTGFYDWGPFVNGGAWIDNAVCKVDVLYRNLDQLEQMVAAAQRGEWEHSFDQQPPFGFRSMTTLGEIHVGKALHDPKNVLGALKARVAIYPPALKSRIVQDALWLAQFSLRVAQDFAKAGDVPNTVGCMTRIFHYLVHALFALNETYFLNDKRVLKEIEGFTKKPSDFGARASAVLAAPGGSAEKLGASLDVWKTLFAETVALADGAYTPKFPTT